MGARGKRHLPDEEEAATREYTKGTPVIDTVERLCDKSQEAFILAIELYNRPTIKYRVEGCAFFLCNAWELLLKAFITKRRGEEAIYYPGKNGRTLSLDDCIRKVFTNANDPLRRNLERVVDLRNTSTHFVVEEYEGIYAPILQACVENYDRKARELMGIEISDRIPENHLMLSVRRSSVDMEECRARYSPEVVGRMISARSDVLSNADEDGNRRYAFTYTTELRMTKRKDADLEFRIDSGSDMPVAILKQVVDPKDKYPFRAKAVVEAVNRKVSKAGIKLECGGCAKPSFTTSDFNLFTKLYGMKDDQRYSTNTNMGSESAWYAYSQQAIDDIFAVLKANPSGAIDEAKQALSKKKEAFDDRPQEQGNSKP